MLYAYSDQIQNRRGLPRSGLLLEFAPVRRQHFILKLKSSHVLRHRRGRDRCNASALDITCKDITSRVRHGTILYVLLKNDTSDLIVASQSR